MTNEEKKLVVDLLGSYRNHVVKLICCPESINAYDVNRGFARRVRGLLRFLKTTKLTKLSFAERLAYRMLVCIMMDEIYSSACKKLIMDKSTYDTIMEIVQKLYNDSNRTDVEYHYVITKWKYIPARIYKLYVNYMITYIALKKIEKFVSSSTKV